MDWSESGAIEGAGARFHFPEHWGPALERVGLQRLDSPLALLQFCADLAAFGRQRAPELTLKAADTATTERLLSFESLLRAAMDADPMLVLPSEQFLSDVRLRLNQVEWRPSLERANGTVLLRHHAYIKDWDGLYALLAVLLLDGRNRRLIARCHYPPCPNFYVHGVVGRPGDYCSPKHRDKDASPRKRRVRAGEKLLEKYPAGGDAIRAAVLAAAREHPNVKEAETLAAHAEARLKRQRKKRK